MQPVTPMRSVKLKLLGRFWDSQIYSSELILFDDEGGSLWVDWAAALDDIAQQFPDVQTGLRVAFKDSDLFYNNKVRKILFDPAIKAPILQQLESLGSQDYEVSIAAGSSGGVVQKDSPFDFLPVDTEIYYSTVFAGDDSGLYSAKRSSFSGGLHSVADKHHDAMVLQIKASDRFTAIATAMGDDGLFEFEVSPRDEADILSGEKNLSPRPCSACDWAFQSVVGWTPESSFFVNYFANAPRPGNSRPERTFDRVVDGSHFFDVQNTRSIVWGAREKLYSLTDAGIAVSDYVPKQRKVKKEKDGSIIAPPPGPSFDTRGTINERFPLDAFVSAGTAPFGNVIELDDRIVVVRSDGEIENFPGEPVHWRIFPRSSHYSNQLHIIYDDYLLIVSFVHDYFVDQESKLAGFTRSAKPETDESKSS
jgi:hypothetical protein